MFFFFTPPSILKRCREVKDSPISLVLNDTSRTSGPDGEAGGCAEGIAMLGTVMAIYQL